MKRIIALMVLIVLATSADAAVQLTLTATKQTYSKGDIAQVIAKVKNTGTTNETIRLTWSTSSDTGAVESDLDFAFMTIKPGEEKERKIFNQKVDSLLDGVYKVNSGIFRGQELIDRKEVEFTVQNVMKIPAFELKACKDSTCSETLSYIIVGKPSWLKVESKDNVQAKAQVTTPDGKTQNLSLPGGYTPLNQGTYAVKITVSGDGLKTTEKTTMIPAVSEEPKLTATEVCNANGACDDGENSLNCPEDCTIGMNDRPCKQTSDGICDQNCGPNADPDCANAEPKGGLPCIPLLLTPIAVILSAVGINFKP